VITTRSGDCADFTRSVGRFVFALCALALASAAGQTAASEPFDLASIRDPSTLEIKTLFDWRDVEADPPYREKLIEITVCQWWPGQKVRIPVGLIAPAVDAPCRFVMLGETGLNATSIRTNPFVNAMLERDVGHVQVGIGPIEVMEPRDLLNQQMNERLLESKDERYTPAWIWGMSYMRALTAAMTEPVFSEPQKIGVTGGSKRGVASACCGIHDDRFTAIMPVVAPVMRASSILVASDAAQSELQDRIRRSDERFLAKLESGTTDLGTEVEQNLKVFIALKDRTRLDRDEYLEAGWTEAEIAEVGERIGNIFLISNHLPRVQKRGLAYMYQVGTTDNVTPDALAVGQRYPEFPRFVFPAGQHGGQGLGFTRRTPQSPEAAANRLAFFSNHFCGDRPMGQPGTIQWRRDGRRIIVEVRFEKGPAPESGELYWTFDDDPPGSYAYNYAKWDSSTMRQVSSRVWVGEFDAPDSIERVRVVSLHRDDHETMPIYMSGPLVEFDPSE